MRIRDWSSGVCSSDLTVAILHDKQTYGSGVATQVRDNLTKGGTDVPLFEGINVGDNDYSAVITKLKALDPDLIYFGGYHAELGLLLRQAREQGLQTQFMGPEGVSNKDLVALAGDRKAVVEGNDVSGRVDLGG